MTGDSDGLPNVVLEAMTSGRAVVASDVTAIGAAVRAAGAEQRSTSRRVNDVQFA